MNASLLEAVAFSSTPLHLRPAVESMASKPIVYPGLASVPRFRTLLASLLVTLCAGTNYVFSAYAPQLGSRLHISHTQLNIVGLAGNIGVNLAGPLWGRIVDLQGPSSSLASASVLLLLGYTGIRYIFDAGLPANSTAVSAPTFYALVLCGFMTGVGGIAGLTSAINATAKSFPDEARATATGIVNSGFGLSAFLFSIIARVEFTDDTSSFLLLLSLGTSIPMIGGYFFVRTIPLPPSPSESASNSTVEGGSRDEDERTPQRNEHARDRNSDRETSALLAGPEAIQRYVGSPHNISGASEQLPLSRRAALDRGISPNVYGHALLTSGDFWLLFSIFSILGGTGLMFINNVGSISRALYIKSVDVYNPKDAARWQADQVFSISLLNFSGRILIGLLSDYTKTRLGFPYSYALVLVSVFFLISQVMAAFVVADVEQLWMASSMLGLAYGAMYSVLLYVCLEWFGMQHLSENCGYLSLSPIAAANLFSIVFGRNLDAHDNAVMIKTARSISTATACTLGRECYVDALYLTTGSCFLAVLLSVWAGWRDQRLVGRY